METMNSEEALERARVRVHRRRELYIHAVIYAVVMGGVALLNWVMTPTFWWVLFPAIGWGIGLALARRVVEDAHRGVLALESTDRGASFLMRIPLAEPAA